MGGAELLSVANFGFHRTMHRPVGKLVAADAAAWSLKYGLVYPGSLKKI